MAASDHLSGVQFMNVHTLMSPKHWDRNMGTPNDFYAADKKYIDHLANDIRERGVQRPVELDENGTIDDGHHRTYAAYLANEWSVPVERAGRHDAEVEDAIGSYWKNRGTR